MEIPSYMELPHGELSYIVAFAMIGPEHPDRKYPRSYRAAIYVGCKNRQDIEGVIRFPSGQTPELVGKSPTLYFICTTFCQVPYYSGPCPYESQEFDFFGDVLWFQEMDTTAIYPVHPPYVFIAGKPTSMDYEDKVIKFRISPNISTSLEEGEDIPEQRRASTRFVCKFIDECLSEFLYAYPTLKESKLVSVQGRITDILCQESDQDHVTGFEVAIDDLGGTYPIIPSGYAIRRL